MPFTVSEIAQLLSGEVIGDPALLLQGFAPADRAHPGDLTFAENESYFARAEQSAASAIIIDGPFASSKKVLIRVPNSRIAFAKVLPLFFPEPGFPAGIHPTALVPATAQVDPTAHIGPYCVLGEKVRIGPRSVLQGSNHLGAGCQLGEEVNLFPQVTLYANTEIGNRVRIHAGTVIGSDGFGYVLDNGLHRKVPQIGNVIIRDDVEIGANVTIDRGALGPTLIGKGSKIDNLVQIAHNVTLGENCLIVSQAGIAGSTKLGNYVISGRPGQVSLATSRSATGSLSPPSPVSCTISLTARNGSGHPAQPDRQAKRQMIALQQLPELLRRVHELEKKTEIIKPSLDAKEPA
jgi:UDP-3-O-[3-hydroxymyristoyl] glucosamine N-acyltransferase